MHLIDKEDDIAIGMAHLVEDRFEALFKLAAIFCTRNQRAHIKAHQGAAFKAVGHIAIGNAQREPFGNRGLARTRLTDDRGVVFGTPCKDLDRTADFFIAPDHGVELAIARGFREVAGELLHRVIGAFSVRAVRFLAAA